MERYVSDTELTIVTGRCYVHTKTWHKPRLTDGKQHPVTITKVAPSKVEANGKSKQT